MFQALVNILLNEPHLEWLREESKDEVYLGAFYCIKEVRMLVSGLDCIFGEYINSISYLTNNGIVILL